MTTPRWQEGTRATRAQVKEEWRLHILKQMKEYNVYYDKFGGENPCAENFAQDLAEEFVSIMAEAIKRATGQELP